VSEISRHIRQLQTAAKKVEATAAIVDDLREYAKTDGGRLTPFGKNLVGLCLDAGMQQSEIAKILEISNSAVSQNVSRLKNADK
jgi:Mn-dependent DtxR family transcriptional regulator